MAEWISCMQTLPQHGEKVWYYGPDIGVWHGRYERHPDDPVSPHLFFCEQGAGVVDRMDAPWWMPYSETRPEPPREEE